MSKKEIPRSHSNIPVLRVGRQGSGHCPFLSIPRQTDTGAWGSTMSIGAKDNTLQLPAGGQKSQVRLRTKSRNSSWGSQFLLNQWVSGSKCVGINLTPQGRSTDILGKQTKGPRIQFHLTCVT